MKPVFLFADSRLLFSQAGGEPPLSLLLDHVPARPSAAYIGASNGDRVEFYEIFCAAMEAVGVPHQRMVRSEPTEAEVRFLEEADIILLAGGDPVRGFRAMERNGLKGSVARRCAEGAVLCGVSAGAVQLGAGLSLGTGAAGAEFLRTFHVVPRVIDVHDEARWLGLRRSLRSRGGEAKGLGIPAGGGLRFDSELDSVEPMGRPLCELELCGNGFRERQLFPAGALVR